MPTITQVDAPLGALLEQRVRHASNLWRHGISADLMYDGDIDNNVTSHLTRCCAEGILYVLFRQFNILSNGDFLTVFALVLMARFLLWETRHGTYKVKSVLKGTETEGE